jgi:hypothetical protein
MRMNRFIFVTTTLIALAAEAGGPATDPPIAAVELRLGAGAGTTGWHDPPVAFGVAGELAVLAEPFTSLVGELYVDRPTTTPVLGVAAGARVRPAGALRLTAMSLALLGPDRIYGLRAGIGACTRGGWVRLCLDLEGTAYVAPAEPPSDRIAAEIRAVLGLAIPLL